MHSVCLMLLHNLHMCFDFPLNTIELEDISIWQSGEQRLAFQACWLYLCGFFIFSAE